MINDLYQLFDAESSTFTYLLVDPPAREAVLIDPVDRQTDRDLALIARLQVNLKYVIETHAHADHVTSAGVVRERTGALAAAPSGCGISPADIQLEDGTALRFGTQSLLVVHTPGHTAGSMCFVWGSRVFTGDTLLINGCGRTDFQSGSATALFRSVTNRLFTLPDSTTVYPGHDYTGFTSSTIGIERRCNPRLANKSEAEFIAIMDSLNLPKPKLIDVAVPANQNLGLPHAA